MSTRQGADTRRDATSGQIEDAGRRDLLQLLAGSRVTLEELHDAYEKRGDEIEQLAVITGDVVSL
jgi:hypothetical protein